MIYPQNFEEKLDFVQIRQWVAQRCLCRLGEERADEMRFSADDALVRLQLERVVEFVRVLESEEEFPHQNFYDVRPALKRVRIEGLYMEEADLFDLKRSLEAIMHVVRYFQADEEVPYPKLSALSADVPTFPQLIARIDAIVDKFGKIKDTASPLLQQIRRELAATTNGISRSLHSILRSAQSEGLVEKDVAPTMRGGRLVIPIAPGMKRKIKGIIHDESATGKTVYVEPAEVVEANNRIRELEADERREIIRILTECSAQIRPQVDDMLLSYEYLAEIDFIRAKALLAREMHACLPEITDHPIIDLTDAYHPVLRHSLEKHGRKMVPLNILLTPAQRILLISGPNAGGKSVCLKTVGILQYMLQSGLLIPVHERSKIGLFERIFLDIGDEQSIEDDLSTYSSHLLNMKYMLRASQAQTLLLIDEFGSGTEPQIGGAMAEAILKRFCEKGAFGVITTHYQNLKHYADAHEGIVNGAMLYDRHEMRALFQLQIGNPGSSFAVEIARKIGLPEEIIADASDIVGSEYIQSDKYLQDIVRDKKYWETKRQNIRKREKQMEETIATYQAEMTALQEQKKTIIAEAKREAERLIHASNAQIENTIRTIRESQAEKESTREARQALEDFKRELEKEKAEKEAKISRKMEQLQARQERKKNKPEKPSSSAVVPAKPKPRSIKVQDYVRIKGQQTTGQVIDLTTKSATVMFGAMKTNVKIEKLEHASAPERSTELGRGTSFVSVQTQDAMHEKRLHFRQEIDVRGMRGDEAIQTVMYFIDDAVQVGANTVRILHGTGNGILRTLIREYLATASGVADYRDEHIQLGGAGITVVKLV